MTKVWNFHRLTKEATCDNETCIKWCQQNRLLPTTMMCSEGHLMQVKQSKGLGKFRCQKKHTHGKNEQRSRASGTWFEHSKVSPERNLVLLYCFSVGSSFENAITESSFDEVTSGSTVTDFFKNCRELVTIHLVKEMQQQTELIGGSGFIIEIFECKIGPRRYSNEEVREGRWVVVMVEKRSRQFRLEVVENCCENFSTLIDRCAKYVVIDSVIQTQGEMSNELLQFSSFVLNAESLKEGKPMKVKTMKRKLKNEEEIDTESSVDIVSEYLFRKHCKKFDIFPKMIEIIGDYFQLP